MQYNESTDICKSSTIFIDAQDVIQDVFLLEAFAHRFGFTVEELKELIINEEIDGWEIS